MATENNLWVSLLRESSKRSIVSESSCVLLGEKESGKRTLMEKICSNPCKTDNDDILSYNYFDVEEGAYEFSSKINMWSFGESIFDKSSEIIGTGNVQQKLIFFIAIDLSKADECVPSLLKWLAKVSLYVRRLEQPKQSKASYISYLKTARMNKGNVFIAPEHSETVGEDAKLDFISEHFSVPIVVVGTKCDLMRNNDGLSAKKARELQGQLRAICLDAGASLIYTSNPLGSTEPSTSSWLKEYLLHRLYPESLALQHGIEDAVESTFIPSGFDTADMIRNSSGLDSLYDFKSKLAQLQATAAESKSEDSTEVGMVTSTSDYQADLEHEQEWLTGLQHFINQVAAAGASASAGSTAGGNAASGPSPAPTVSSLPSSKAPSETALNTLDDTSSVNGSTAGNDAETAKKPLVRPTRKLSTTAKPGDTKDATDYFKKMLEASNKK